jgi:DNA-binding SARP family transcriptional activator
MEFTLLGSLAVTVDGRRIEITARKQRILLAVLLKSPNEPVPTDRLVDALWGSNPPHTAGDNIRAYVYHLRKALGAETRLLHRAGGYLVVVRPGELDVDKFDSLVEEAKAARLADDLSRAQTLLGQALDLWRGPAFDDVADIELLRAEADRLQERRLTAIEEWIDVQLSLGHQAEVVHELRAQVSRNPYRERLRGQLMLAYHRIGRRADALAEYEMIRRMLATDLGIDPGQALQRLHDAILHDDAGLTGTSAPPPPAELPVDVATFTGRAAELALLLGSCRAEGGRPRAATLVFAIDGMAGIGKTALGIHAAHRLAADYPDGQLFVDLHGHSPEMAPTEPGQALDHLLRGLGVPDDRIPYPVETKAALYRTQTADKRMLVLLDDARGEDQVRPLLPASAGCLVLVTSRRRLAGLDEAVSISLDVLSTPEATVLFNRITPPDRLAGEPSELLDEVVELCGGLPLAIRIAAARLRHRRAWTLTHLAERLRGRPHLAELRINRHSVATTIDMSYQRLASADQRMFRLLGLHPGATFDSATTAALAGVGIDHAATALEELHDANLLQERSPGRYQFHDLIREHASAVCESHESTAGRHEALRRLVDHYVRTSGGAIAAAYPHQAGQAHQAGFVDKHLSGLGLVRRMHRVQDRHEKVDLCFEVALHLAEERGDRRDGELHALRILSRFTPALARLAEAFVLAQEFGDRHGELHALIGQGHGYQLLRDADAAHRGVRRAIDILDQLAITGIEKVDIVELRSQLAASLS